MESNKPTLQEGHEVGGDQVHARVNTTAKTEYKCQTEVNLDAKSIYAEKQNADNVDNMIPAEGNNEENEKGVIKKDEEHMRRETEDERGNGAEQEKRKDEVVKQHRSQEGGSSCGEHHRVQVGETAARCGKNDGKSSKGKNVAGDKQEGEEQTAIEGKKRKDKSKHKNKMRTDTQNREEHVMKQLHQGAEKREGMDNEYEEEKACEGQLLTSYRQDEALGKKGEENETDGKENENKREKKIQHEKKEKKEKGKKSVKIKTKDCVKLKQKLAKIDAKIVALSAKKADILMQIKEAQEEANFTQITGGESCEADKLHEVHQTVGTQNIEKEGSHDAGEDTEV